MPSIACSRTEREILPMFARCKIARTPGIFSAAVVSRLRIRPLAIVASTGTAYNIPGKWKSEVYCAFPVTFNGPSMRGVSRPIGDVAGISCVSDMFCSFDESCRRHLQRVREAALGQLDLEPILTLRFGVAQRRLRRVAEARQAYRLADQRGFRLRGSPWLGPDAAHCD